MRNLERLLIWMGLACLACHAAGTARTDVAPAGGAPMATTTLASQPDTQFAQIRTRFEALHYRIDVADSSARRLVVRPPGDETRVEVRVVATGDSSGVSVAPLGASDLVASMRALLTVTHDAMIDTSSPSSSSGAGSGELPPSRWRPAFFVAPDGRLWMARSGLFSTDSLMGRWSRSFGSTADHVNPDRLRIGTTMAFVSTDTLLLGLRNRRSDEQASPLLFRSTDAGQSWSAVTTPDLTSIDAMAAMGSSVWVVGTWFPSERDRRAMLLRSSDGGTSWDRPTLPNGMNDVVLVYRVTSSLGYAATAGYNKGPVFWRTSDRGSTWTPLPTPHDEGINDIPSYGSRVEEIATIGPWLVVREYGKVFVSRADTVRWRPFPRIDHIAADRAGDRLFVLTDSLQAAMLGPDLSPIWKTSERIPDSQPSDVEDVVAHDGVGYVVTGHGVLYEARERRLRMRRPQ